MNITLRFCVAISLTVGLMANDAFARGFGGGGRRSGGGVSRGGGSARTQPARRQPSGTRSSVGQRDSKSVTGPRAGSVTAGGAQGAARGPTGGVKVEGPGGRTAARGGAQGAVRPGGAAAGQVRAGGVSGPRGAAGTVQSRGTGRNLSTGAGFSRYRGGVAVRGSRGAAVGHRTRAVSVSARRSHAAAVRRGFGVRHPYGRWFTGGWYAQHPRAWRAARWATATVWAAVTWDALSRWWYAGTTTAAGSTATYYYDYGNTIVYEGNTVYYEAEPVATAEEYYDQASEIAGQGEAKGDEDQEWQSFGVFAMVQDDEEEADKILQLAVNKDGVIRGNHYDALTETALPIEGSVDEKSQRAAWTVGDNSRVVYETGIYNLTQDETEMLIHFGTDRTQQWTLVRLEEPDAASD